MINFPSLTNPQIYNYEDSTCTFMEVSPSIALLLATIPGDIKFLMGRSHSTLVLRLLGLMQETIGKYYRKNQHQALAKDLDMQ